MITIDFLDAVSDLDAEQIFALYRREGWWDEERPAPGVVERIVRGSHCFAVARMEERIIGMGRAISDGVSDAYLQDVTVHPDFRGKGIAGRLIGHLLARLRADGISWVGLIAQLGSEQLYRRQGFAPMPDALSMFQEYYEV